MAQNRIQFQPGMSIPEFIAQYGTEEQCAAALEPARRLSLPALSWRGARRDSG